MSDDPIMDVTSHHDEDNDSLPEAPASVSVRFWIDDYGVMLTMRSKKVGDVVNQLEYIIDTAKKKGWKSVWDKDKAEETQKKSSTSSDTPVCSIHNRKMKKFSGRYGEFYKCTAKIGDNEWCDQKQNIK